MTRTRLSSMLVALTAALACDQRIQPTETPATRVITPPGFDIDEGARVEPSVADLGGVTVDTEVTLDFTVTVVDDARVAFLTGIGSVDFDTCHLFEGPGTCNLKVSFTMGTTPMERTIGFHECLVSAIEEHNCRCPTSESCTSVYVTIRATPVLIPSATALTSSLNPSAIGDFVTFTATVTSVSDRKPSGTVVFSTGAATLGTASIFNGVASIATSALAVGTHRIEAVYQGTPWHQGSSAELTQQVLDARGLLELLLGAVTGTGPGGSLADKIRLALEYEEAGDTLRACRTLAAFLAEVSAQAGKAISTTEAAELTAAAEKIRALLGC